MGESESRTKDSDSVDKESDNKDKKSTEGEDDDKENKSDSGSVVDLEKEERKEQEKKDGENKEEDLTHLGRWEPYYKSTLGKFFLELGLNQAQEFLQADLMRMQKRKLDKM